MIKNIIFDFGGVLIDWNPHNLYDGYFGDKDKAQWFIDNICTSEWNSQMDKGKPFDVGVAELVAKFPEWEKEIRVYQSRWHEMVTKEVPGMVQLLTDLKQSGYPIYGLTNWSDETMQDEFKRWGIFRLVDDMVVSGREKILKPDPALYNCLLTRFNLKPEECVFIDDNQKNVDAAERMGIHALHFEGAEKLRAALKEMDVKI
ncbi:MAG: HAD family phosphatase [Paludibacteraceae bacterium]|nr:HAD family phosphatase [Paludibacteraceae bacterium]